jgi:DNA-directed RNA polymerase I subunit RPA43
VIGYRHLLHHTVPGNNDNNDRFTIANEMLSLRGSIQPDPFSPAHIPQTTMKAMSEPASESSTAVVRDVMLPFQEEEEEEEEGEDEEIDMFERLGRMGDEAVVLEAKRRAEEAAKAKEDKKKKRKRKDSGNEGKGRSRRERI